MYEMEVSMKRWVVKINENDLKNLKPELLDVGTLIHTEEGEQYMIFRENFSALKLASELSSSSSPISTSLV